MNRIERAFADGKAFIAYVTAGDPTLAATGEFIVAMAEAGADIIEIGIPFSDPVAEGPVIQEANIRALQGHTTVSKVLELVREVRQQTQVPLVLLTYLNPVFNYGITDFFKACRQAGVDGIIIPDMPFEERRDCAAAAAQYGIAIISMIAPTSASRCAAISAVGEGFLYIVSSLGVTGVRSRITTDLAGEIREIRKYTRVPCAVGFGIGTPAQAARIATYADGVIVGSAIVKLIARYGARATPHLTAFVREMKAAVTAGNGSGI